MSGNEHSGIYIYSTFSKLTFNQPAPTSVAADTVGKFNLIVAQMYQYDHSHCKSNQTEIKSQTKVPLFKERN